MAVSGVAYAHTQRNLLVLSCISCLCHPANFKDLKIKQEELGRHRRLRNMHGKLPRGSSCQLCRSKDVVDYLIYMAEDRKGANRSLLGSSA